MDAFRISLAAVVAVTVGALAQDEPLEPAEPRSEPLEMPGDPQLRDPSLERLVAEVDGRPVVDDEFAPTPDPRADPVHAALDVLGPEAPSGSRPAEGTFVVRMVGEVVRIGDTDLAFIPDDPESPGMVLVRSDVRRRVAEVMGEGDSTRAALTGEVLLYHNRVLLLPTAYAPAADVEPVAPAVDGEVDAPQGADEGDGRVEPTTEAPDQDDPQALDPRVTALEAELRRERERQRGLTPTLDREAQAGESAAPISADAETGFVVRRRGRMVRLPDGWWAVAFDQDGDAREAPMPIVPCRALELMERTAARLGESWTFEVTGRVVMAGTVAQIVPSLFISEPPSGVMPRQ